MTKSQNISVKRYRQIKLKLRTLEEANYDSIMLIPCSGDKGWYEMAEHSALIYYYEVCQKLKRKVKFYADALSFYDQYKTGYIRSLGVEPIRGMLKKVGLYKKEAVEGEMVVFYLKTRYSKKKIEQLEEAEQKRRQQNLAPEPTGSLNPALHQILTSLSMRLHKLCNQRLDKLSSRTNGVAIVRLIDNMLEEYHKIAMLKPAAYAKALDKYANMRTEAYVLIIKIRVLGEARLWDLETCSGVMEPLTKARDLIEQEISKIQNRKAKSGVEKSGRENKTDGNNAGAGERGAKNGTN